MVGPTTNSSILSKIQTEVAATQHRDREADVFFQVIGEVSGAAATISLQSFLFDKQQAVLLKNFRQSLDLIFSEEQKNTPMSASEVQGLLACYKAIEQSKKEYDRLLAEGKHVIFSSELEQLQGDIIRLIDRICSGEQPTDSSISIYMPKLEEVQLAQKPRITEMALQKAEEELKEFEATITTLKKEYAVFETIGQESLSKIPLQAAQDFPGQLLELKKAIEEAEDEYTRLLSEIQTLKQEAGTEDRLVEAKQALSDVLQLKDISGLSYTLADIGESYVLCKAYLTQTTQSWRNFLWSGQKLSGIHEKGGKGEKGEVKVKRRLEINKGGEAIIYTRITDQGIDVMRKPKEKSKAAYEKIEKELKMNEEIFTETADAKVAKITPERRKKDQKINAVSMQKYQGSVEEVFQGKTVLPEQFLSIAVQMAEGISACHKVKLVHRDVKLGNFLYEEDDSKKPPEITVALSDFGLAAKIGEKSPPVGSVEAMPPRFFHGSLQGETRPISISKPTSSFMLEEFPVDFSDDVWSYGVALLFLKYPNKLDNPLMDAAETFFKDVKDAKISEEEKKDNLLVWWQPRHNHAMQQVVQKLKSSQDPMDAIILQCFEYDPQKRPTIENIVAQLKGLSH